MGARSAVGDLIDEASQFPTPELFRRRALEHASRFIGCDSAIFLPTAPEPPGRWNRPPDHPSIYEHYRAFQAVFARELARAHAVGRRRGAYVDTQVYGAAELRRMRFFSEVLRPQRVTSRVVAHVLQRHQLSATVQLCRHDGGRFDDDACERMRALLPALTVTYAAVCARLTPPSQAVADRLDGLSRRERQIVDHVRRGLRNKEIALLLGTSPLTVRNQLSRIFERLGLNGRAELAAWGERRFGDE